MVSRKQVCVIGAGVSGLAAAKAFAARGHQVTIVERSGDLGGVWEPARSYPEVQTQSPKDLYRYTDKAMPDSYPEWPKGPQVHAYLTDYAREPRSRLARSASTRRWRDGRAAPTASRAGARSAGAGRRHQQRGFRFRRRLHRPVQRATDASACPARMTSRRRAGASCTPRNTTTPTIAKGRKVVVLGGSKSATDIAVNAVNSGAAEVTLVYREPVWRIPYFIGGLVNFKRILYIRAQEEMFRSWGIGALSRLRACHRKAAGLGELARAGEPAEGAAQARQMRDGAGRADRGRRQLLGADRNARTSSRWSRTAASRRSAAPSTATTAIAS